MSLDNQWRLIREAHAAKESLGSRGPLPRVLEPVLVYVRLDSSAQIAAVHARSLAEADAALRAGIGEAWPQGSYRATSFFVRGHLEDLRRVSPLLRAPQSFLRGGHPWVVTSRAEVRTRAPRSAGIYRVYATTEDGVGRIYIGQAVNMRRRLLDPHDTIDSWGWQSITKIELLEVPRRALGRESQTARSGGTE